MTNEVALSIIAVLFIFTLYAGLIAMVIISYILTAKAMYKLSVRRNISCPWMAWVPGLNLWNIGCVANEYDERLGMKRRWNLILVAAYGAYMAIYSLYAVFYAIFMVSVSAGGYNGFAIFFLIMALLVLIPAIIVISVASTVEFICFFKIFESTVPEKAVKYLILSLVVPLASAVCLMKCADKGYPFPQSETVYEAPIITE